MVALLKSGLTLWAAFVQLTNAAALDPPRPAEVRPPAQGQNTSRPARLGPLPGTDPRILNGTCPSTDKYTTCPPPAPATLKVLECDNYDTASRRDYVAEFIEHRAWRYANGGRWHQPFCDVPAQTCRRFGCYRTTGLFVCNHNFHDIKLDCGSEVDLVGKRIEVGCCTRKSPWAADGLTGHYTTDQGWKVVIAHADCSQPEDAIIPNKTGRYTDNGKCENVNDGFGEDDGIPITQWTAMPNGLWSTTTVGYGETATPYLKKPEETWSKSASTKNVSTSIASNSVSISTVTTTVTASLGTNSSVTLPPLSVASKTHGTISNKVAWPTITSPPKGDDNRAAGLKGIPQEETQEGPEEGQEEEAQEAQD